MLVLLRNVPMVMLFYSVTAVVLVVAGSDCFDDGDPSSGAITGSIDFEFGLDLLPHGEQREHDNSCGVYSDYVFHVSYQC